MSIVQNLKILNKPIAELAMLPQEAIIQLAQSGQIPVGFVAPILGEKAEQSKAAAALAAMRTQQQMPAPTVLEGIMAQNAMGEMQEQMPPPDQMTEAGVAALPAPNMESIDMAGGGIVAFQAGGQSKEDIERILREAQMGRGPNVSRPGIANPLPQGLEPSDVPQTPYFMNPEDFVEFDEEEIVETGPASANLPGIDINAIMGRAEGIASALRPKREKVPTVQEASQQTSDILAASGYDTSVLDTIRRDVEQQRESLKEDRKEAMNLRLIEAGLAIMGGTSPYAFENIGKGATGAIKGLSQDIKDLKKSERELRSAEQNLMLKQNDAAMGKARITQSTIDKAQERYDRAVENDARTKADFTKTLLSGEIQERLAKATYSTKMTDFDKQWRLYSAEAKANGENPTFSGFQSYIGDRPLTMKDALTIASKDQVTGEGSVEERARALLEADRNYRSSQRGGAGQQANLSQDQQALNWANANPNDPRAKQIKDYLGAK